jgi:hypothetical protein
MGEENHNEHKACITAANECGSYAGSQRAAGKNLCEGLLSGNNCIAG